MIKKNFSKIRFYNESKTYRHFCLNCFALGYLTGCFYVNKKIERKFDVLQFQFIETREFLMIRGKFFDLLKKTGLRDDGSGVIFSFLGMNEGFKSGLKNEIPEMRDKDGWDSHKKYCKELFLSKFDRDIKNEYLALSDDKGAFLFLRKKEFDLQVFCIEEVKRRINDRESSLSAQDDNIIKFSFQVADEIANEIANEHLSQLEFATSFSSESIYQGRTIGLRLSALIMRSCTLFTGLGSSYLREKIVQKYREKERLEVYEKINNLDLDVAFMGYLDSARSISYILKNSGKNQNNNFIFSDENESELIKQFNKLILDSEKIYIGRPLVLRILNFVGAKIENFKTSMLLVK